MQDDLQSLAAAAASAVQMQLTAAEDAADAQPVDALKACSALRAALAGHTTELQRWAVSLHVESVRQSSASKRLAEREAATAEIRALEAAVEEQKSAARVEKDDLLSKQVSFVLILVLTTPFFLSVVPAVRESIVFRPSSLAVVVSSSDTKNWYAEAS